LRVSAAWLSKVDSQAGSSTLGLRQKRFGPNNVPNAKAKYKDACVPSITEDEISYATRLARIFPFFFS
jgi:hypothetical protein